MNMKFLNTWLCSLSSLLITTVSPGFAQDTTVDSDDSGAKGLFFQQMETPNVAINTGVQYWIELRRDGETIHANNKTKFRSGDAIRFHVKPNIDGFAYILLRDGSHGEESQLFPDAAHSEDSNKIVHGKEMILPAGGDLIFDHNPGLEKLTLLISRKPIDAKAFVSGESSEKNHAPSNAAPQRIAMACSGSKDLIPNQVLVSYVSPSGAYGSQLKDMPAAQHLASTSSETKTALAGTSTLRPSIMQSTSVPAKVAKETSSKDVALKASKAKTQVTASTKTASKDDVPTLFGSKKTSATTKRVAKANIAKRKNTVAPAVVTVVYKNPDGVLAADISLEHL
jgi:hypothetical protein